MTLPYSTKLVPELQTWFNNFVVNSEVNKYGVPTPVPVGEVYLPKKSFIELLFNENYPYNEYKYFFTENSNKAGWPQMVLTRMAIYAASARYMVLSDTGTNSFLLQPHDFILLDALLAYRQTPTNIRIVDSTSIDVYFDSTSNETILTAEFNSLGTPLSKLIYLYLQLKINDNYEYYNNLQLVTAGTLLETMYELVLIDEYFKYMTAREVDIRLRCQQS